jgi:elongation factor G
MDVEVTAPSAIAGDVIGHPNSRRGKIAGMEPADEMTVVRAQVPMAEMLNYEPHLRSMSGGRGSYSTEFSHYEELRSGAPLEAWPTPRAGAGARRKGHGNAVRTA